MKNLIAELLVKLSEKEQKTREMAAQLEALEIVVSAMLRHTKHNEQGQIINQIELALASANSQSRVSYDDDDEAIHQYIKKLLQHLPA
ncbi:anti-adapter protein IraP [Salmonella enterica subsp. enterica serovar Choleraesuis]|nr:anti-adapter protein IraP [Salmonella enterica subsp. enterica serovar Choleraesuis]